MSCNKSEKYLRGHPQYLLPLLRLFRKCGQHETFRGPWLSCICQNTPASPPVASFGNWNGRFACHRTLMTAELRQRQVSKCSVLHAVRNCLTVPAFVTTAVSP